MTEVELKFLLDAEAEARLRRHPALRRARTRALLSIYCDTPDFALAAAGIALRLRRDGRAWIQSVKKRPCEMSRGLFAAIEVEHPAPGGRLRLDHDDAEGVYREIAARVDGAALGPAFKTAIKRTRARIAVERGVVEVALDRGEVIAGALSTPIRELELELVEGEVAALFAVARSLFDRGPLRFSREPKSALGLRLASHGVAEAPLAPRGAGDPTFVDTASLADAARAVLRDCLAQIADNAALVATSEEPEGPHQLRVGLRRLRCALAVFQPLLGRDTRAALAATAKRLGQIVGPLRDLDVLIGEVVPSAAAQGLGTAERDALIAALKARRTTARDAVRAALAAPEVARFLLDLGEAIEAIGEPSDPPPALREIAVQALDRRARKAARRARGLESLDAAGLHALRKAVKRLRYAAQMLTPLFPAKAQKRYLKALKRLQEGFGTLNDADMAAALLSDPAAPGRGEPAAERAAGFVLGVLAVRTEGVRPAVLKAWRKLEKTDPYWR